MILNEPEVLPCTKFYNNEGFQHTYTALKFFESSTYAEESLIGPDYLAITRDTIST
jgi:hypothetical protein